MALAAFRKAIFRRLLPLGTLLLSTLPPLILLLGASLSHEVKCLALSNFVNPSGLPHSWCSIQWHGLPLLFSLSLLRQNTDRLPDWDQFLLMHFYWSACVTSHQYEVFFYRVSVDLVFQKIVDLSVAVVRKCNIDLQ